MLACQTTAEPVPATAFVFKYTLAGEPPTSCLLRLRLPSAAVVQLWLRSSSRSLTRATIRQTNKANGAWETLCLAPCLQPCPETFDLRERHLLGFYHDQRVDRYKVGPTECAEPFATSENFFLINLYLLRQAIQNRFFFFKKKAASFRLTELKTDSR